MAIPQNNTVAAIHNTCSVGLNKWLLQEHTTDSIWKQKAVNSRLGRADNARFLERFRYIIVASQLLNTHSFVGQSSYGQSRDAAVPVPDAPQLGNITLAGVAVTASFAFALAWLINWTRGSGSSAAGKGRMVIFLALLVGFAMISYAYMRRQWLQYLRQRSLAEISEFVAKAQEFDTVVAGTLTLVQEVELVSRGYRMYGLLASRDLALLT